MVVTRYPIHGLTTVRTMRIHNDSQVKSRPMSAKIDPQRGGEERSDGGDGDNIGRQRGVAAHGARHHIAARSGRRGGKQEDNAQRRP